MVDSITFTKNGVTKNTYTDWGLVPTGQIDSPGLVENERTGTINFMMRFGDVPIDERVSGIEAMLLGDENPVAVFSADRTHEYNGKWGVKKHQTIGVGLKIEMTYTLGEFKFEKTDVNSKWEWDEFDFANGEDTSGVFDNLEATDDKKYTPLPMTQEELKGYFGDAPVSPEFHNKSDAPMSFKVNGKIKKLDAGEKKAFDDLVIDPTEDIQIAVKGKGFYAISFTRGVR